MIDFKTWTDAQIEEKKWWGNFVNTYVEEQKQFFYADKMEIYFSNLKSIDLFKQSILDIGSNAISMLLRAYNGGKLTVVDPIEIPQWAVDRYKANKVEYIKAKGEDYFIPGDIDPLVPFQYDECWIYNCLQHVQDPEAIIKNAWRHSKVLRIFEWLGETSDPNNKEQDKKTKTLHPVHLNKQDLDKWIGKKGQTEVVNLPLIKGECYYGVFIK